MMKFAILSCLLALSATATADKSHTGRHLREHRDLYGYECTEEYPCYECDPYDCDKDSDCYGNLLCADEHEDELEAAGYSRRRANCGGGTPAGVEVCFDPDLLKLGYCEGDCDKDSDCAGHLLCAENYKDLLKAVGCGRRTANCNVQGDGKTEYCFDPYEVIYYGC